MTTLWDRLARLLAAIVDEQWARHNAVIERGLHLRGEWASGRLFVQGEELEPPDWEDREKPWGQLRRPTPKWRWGETGEESRATARAILEWFLDEREASSYLEAFLNDIVSRLPRADFERTVNYERWRNRELSRRSWGQTAQPTGDHPAVMDGDE